jgi:hypothetical protein
VPLRQEPLHLRIKDADAVGIALFRVAAQQLLSHTDAEHGLLQVADHLVEPAGPQVVHRLAGVSLSGKQHLIGRLQQFCIVRQQGFDPHPPQGVDDGIDIPRIIFYYRNIHDSREIIIINY